MNILSLCIACLSTCCCYGVAQLEFSVHTSYSGEILRTEQTYMSSSLSPNLASSVMISNRCHVSVGALSIVSEDSLCVSLLDYHDQLGGPLYSD